MTSAGVNKGVRGVRADGELNCEAGIIASPVKAPQQGLSRAINANTTGMLHRPAVKYN